jgi:hypothetical protein
MKNPEETAIIKMPKPIRTAQTASKTAFVNLIGEAIDQEGIAI